MRGSIPFFVSLCLSLPLFADHGPLPKDGLTNPVRLASPPTGMSRADFEDLELGPLEKIPDRLLERSDNTYVVADGIGGSKSLRHVSDGSGLAAFHPAGPVFERAFHRLSQDVRISAIGSTYQICPVDTTMEYLITRVSFEPDGRILIGEVNHQLDRFQFHDSGVRYTPGQTIEVTVETTPKGLFHVRLDDRMVHTGIETNFAMTGQPGQTNGMLYFTGNEAVGNPGGEGATLTIDNLIPARFEIDKLSIKGETLTIKGECPLGVDIYARGPQGTVLVAADVAVEGAVRLTVPFYPDSVYFASEDGGRSALSGITSGLTVPTLGQWGMFSMALIMLTGGIFFLRKRRLALS
ncbi:MAG: hypothetical protein QNK37_02160 [Acidobacteriota bacterium]|nr:hypothetical protein [Acidobacteriota bacterium]